MQRRGGTLVLLNPVTEVERVLDIMGVADLMPIYRDTEAARAHGEVFGEIRPACSFFGVARFIDLQWLVEVEVDCFQSDD